MFSTSLIITTYNRPDALFLVLQSLARQRVAPKEVIVVDDGSLSGTGKVVDYWRGRLKCQVIHAWQRDHQFRAARSRNLGIEKASGEQIVFVDGDCLMPPWFIEAHRNLFGENTMVAGSRHLLSLEETEQLLNTSDFNSLPLFSSIKFYRLKNSWMRALLRSNWRQVRTCNLSLSRSTLIKVGGFDEAYVGWGREDSDLVIRLQNEGVKIISGRYATCVEHLYHAEESRASVDWNNNRFQAVQRNSCVKPRKSLFI